MQPAPEVVSLHLWGVPGRHIPWALSRMAHGRPKASTVPGLRFAKLLGTGHGRRFTPADADPRHWALIASWDHAEDAAAFEASRIIRGWEDHCLERWHLLLRPITSAGRWSGQQPFGPPTRRPTEAEQGPCAILTRARLKASRIPTFWRAVPPVAAVLADTPGLRFARGIGEAPVGLQATFSIWDDYQAAKNFAYRTREHRRVIERTTETGWYAEQLFARFAVIDASGVVNGRDPLAMREASHEDPG